MSDKSTTSSGGIGFGGLLLAIFITLKLCGVISWSWLWVLAPFWIPLSFLVLMLFVVGVIYLLKS